MQGRSRARAEDRQGAGDGLEPTYDPVERNFARIQRGVGSCRVAPLLNRASSGLFTPGSIFKVVTRQPPSTQAGTPESTFFDPGFCIQYGQRVNNYDTSTPFGTVTFTQAMVNSINSSFCQMGKELGPEVILDYARRFGFYADPPVDLPSGERAPSGLYQGGKLLPRSQESRADPAASRSARSG